MAILAAFRANGPFFAISRPISKALSKAVPVKGSLKIDVQNTQKRLLHSFTLLKKYELSSKKYEYLNFINVIINIYLLLDPHRHKQLQEHLMLAREHG